MLNDDGKYIRAKDIQNMFSVSKATVSNWKRDGIITAYQLKGISGFRYKLSEIKRLIEIV